MGLFPCDEESLFKNRARYHEHMAHQGDCFLVPGPVRMSDACLQAMATPVITARGTEFRDVMADLNAGLRYAFNLTPSSRDRGTESWSGEDGYKVLAVSGSGTAAMEMVIANRFRPSTLPTSGGVVLTSWNLKNNLVEERLKRS